MFKSKITARVSAKALLVLMAFVLAIGVGFGIIPTDRAYAATLTVCASGCNHTTIQAAVTAASSGDTVTVAAGTYVENVVITSKPNLTLQGVGITTVVEPATGIGFAITSSNGVVIKNLKIHTTGTNAHGIWVAGTPNGGVNVTGLTVQDNTIIVDGYSAGIYAERVAPAHSGWLIGGAGHGNTITINSGAGVTGDGADLHDVSASEVSYNTITLNTPTDSTNVLWTSESSSLASLVFSNNTVSGSSGSEIAIVTDFLDAVADTSIATVTISGNTFSLWGSRALRIGAASGAGTVSGVTASGNTFQMTADTTEVIGGTGAGSVTKSSNIFNVSGTAKIQKAIGAAGTGDTINVAAGTYTEDLSIPSGKTGLNLFGAGLATTTIKGVAIVVDGSYPLATPNINILSSGVKLHGFTIESPNYVAANYASGLLIGASNVEIYSNAFMVYATTDGNTSMGNGIQTWHKDVQPGVDISGLSIHDNTFTHQSVRAAGYEGIYLNLDVGSTAATVQNNTFTGNIFRAITTERSNTTISGNSITNGLVPSGSGYTGTGGWQGINIGGANAGAIGTVTVSGNTVQGSASDKGFSYGIKLGYNGTSTFSSVSVTGNTVHHSGTAGVWAKITASGIVVNAKNDLSGNVKGVKNDDGVNALNAIENWWGTSVASEVLGLTSGNVNFNPWYSTVGMTTLVVGSSATGQADLGAGVTTMALTNSGLMDLSTGVATAAGDAITVGGAAKTLSSFTSGDLAGVNLGVAQTVGSSTVTVNRAVRIESGTNGTAVTVSNSDFPTSTLSIPDGTAVLAPAGWDGRIQPPKAGTSTGTGPSGFSVGSTRVDVGSANGVLLFDRPVSVIIDGVHAFVGYRPANSSIWTQITQTCLGTYAAPTSPAFPGECFITDAGTVKTKIYTWHLTNFGNLSQNPPAPVASAEASSGGGGGSAILVIPADSNTQTSTTASTLSSPVDRPMTYIRPIQVPSNLIMANAAEQTKTVQITTENGSIVLMPNKLSTVSAAIPASTTVKAPIEWDGKISPPLMQSVTKVSATGDVIQGSKETLARDEVVAVVKVGSDKARLEFNNKVTLTIPVEGLADGSKVAIYSSNAGHQWVYEAEGAVKDGKVVFETNHFTFFALGKTSGTTKGTPPKTPVGEVAGQASRFTDTVGHWAESFINRLAGMGIVKGKAEGIFAPEDSITRAELVKVAVGAYGVEMPESVERRPYVDVEIDAWYAPYVAAAKEAGIISNSASRFNPNVPVTRAEALKILINAADFADVDENFDANYASKEGWTYVGFKDVLIVEWFGKFVAYARDFGIVSGYPDGLFHPEKSMTRAEVAKVVLKVLDQQGK